MKLFRVKTNSTNLSGYDKNLSEELAIGIRSILVARIVIYGLTRPVRIGGVADVERQSKKIDSKLSKTLFFLPQVN